MTAPSFAFLAFGIVGALLFHLLPKDIWRRLILLALNIGFFAFFATGWPSLLPYAGFLAVGYLATLTVRHYRNGALFWACIALVLLIFFWLKRYTFLPQQSFVPFPYVLIGLSYVFFRVLHLVIEARQGGERLTPLSYLNYTMHFPALISGPIQLYPDYRRMEREAGLPLGMDAIGDAAWRIVLGFFKVTIVSVLLRETQNSLISFLHPGLPFFARVATGGGVWAIYPLFLYANFSGYTDFVIGVARLYGFILPENFDHPFLSENFLGFWNRWHITLSSWLKMYVYMPILVHGMRRFPHREWEAWLGVFAYFVTFFLVGAWHGQTSTFLFFGVLQGGGVAGNKLYQIVMTRLLGRNGYRALCARATYRAACRGATFTWFAFTLLWFWSSWSQLAGFANIAGIPAVLAGGLLVWAASTVALTAVAAISSQEMSRLPGLRYLRTSAATAMMMIVIMYVAVSAGPAPDIVYKNF